MAVLKHKTHNTQENSENSENTSPTLVFGQCKSVQNAMLVDIGVVGTSKLGSAFVYSFGCVVIWGLTSEHDTLLVKMLSRFEIEPYSSIEMDEFSFTVSEKTSTKDGDIVIESGPGSAIAMVVVSHALAQSVKIAQFEERVQETILTVEPLAKELQSQGRLASLTMREVGQRIGTLFLLRTQVNFGDIADSPAFLWDLEDLELAHSHLAKYLEIKKRVTFLNDRMDTLGHLYDILRDESNNRHSVQLEWIVIILITLECFLGILPYILKLMDLDVDTPE
eukprot:c14954_g1_i2.p1 GENE.c14954_g1_i2~~c14954_g1_i2.p1  ORF type:complete len:279 (-),score=82.33 c14954_g1_i2:123-959(-)